MKKTILLLTVFLVLLLTGCEGLDQTTVIETDLITTQMITNDFQTTDLFTTEEPTFDDLTTSVVSTDDLSTEAPTTEAPTSAIPTTDEVSTTEVSTTVISTTEVYTTFESTTVEMTTVIPTTEEETTEEMTTEWNPLIDINLFSFNDFHGGAYTDMSMVSNISSYLKSFEGYHLEIANGDIFQGSALSNYYHGRVLVDALNEIGFDGFVIGNHEFDWGIEVIGDYADGEDSNGEFNHPILAANIVYTDSQEPLSFTQPFFIEEFEGVKVGVIGLIGNIENSIASSRLENIEFLDPVETAAQYASSLRTDYDVDIVVVYIHDSSDRNQEYAALTGLEKIDAMFNGHSHQNEASDIDRDGIDMPYAQMNNYDTSLVGIHLTYNKGTHMVIDFNVYGVYNDMMNDTDDVVDDIIEYYSQDVVYLNYINDVLADAESDFGRYDMAQWGASVLRDYAGVDLGAVNAGGFRVTMDAGNVTMGDLITIYPFDNVIKTSEMTGQQILDFLIEIDQYSSDVVFDDSLVYDSVAETVEINGEPIDLDAYYVVGAVDYIFDKTYYDFLEGINVQQTIYYMRDLLVMDLRNTIGLFNPYDGSHFE